MTHFYIIFSPQGGSPTKQHATLEDAETEAKRLASKHQGREFVIMCSQWGYKTSSDAVFFTLDDVKKEEETV
jgi:hypothetical protein